MGAASDHKTRHTAPAYGHVGINATVKQTFEAKTYFYRDTSLFIHTMTRKRTKLSIGAGPPKQSLVGISF